MNHTELRACVATRPPLSNRGFATEVGAVISTLAAVPAHGEMFAIAGFGNSTIRHRADHRDRDPAPVKQPPSSLTIDGLQCLHNQSRCGKPVVRKSRMTFVADARRREFCNRSHVRTHAQSRAQIESPRARVPHMPGCELIPTTALRTGARDEHLTRYPSAYCHRQPHAGAPRSLVDPKVSGGMHLPTSRPEISMAEPFGVDTKRPDLVDSSPMRPYAQLRPAIEFSRPRIGGRGKRWPAQGRGAPGRSGPTRPFLGQELWRNQLFNLTLGVLFVTLNRLILLVIQKARYT